MRTNGLYTNRYESVALGAARVVHKRYAQVWDRFFNATWWIAYIRRTVHTFSCRKAAYGASRVQKMFVMQRNSYEATTRPLRNSYETATKQLRNTTPPGECGRNYRVKVLRAFPNTICGLQQLLLKYECEPNNKSIKKSERLRVRMIIYVFCTFFLVGSYVMCVTTTFHVVACQ